MRGRATDGFEDFRTERASRTFGALTHLEEVMARALAEQAKRMAAQVRDGLSAAARWGFWARRALATKRRAAEPAWARTGGRVAGRSGKQRPSGCAAGTGHGARVPARPFLAPVAAGMGEEVARAVGAAVGAALRGDGPDGFASQRASNSCRDVPDGKRSAVWTRKTPSQASRKTWKFPTAGCILAHAPDYRTGKNEPRPDHPQATSVSETP